jgi:hypothetical protein
MTYKEKFALDHPKMEHSDRELFYSHFCPDSVYDAKDPDYCIGDNSYGHCTNCWGREISEFNSQSEFNEQPLTPEEKQTLSDMQAECCTIKDSGDRTEFSSGAVRDMRTGKGRCDLTPLEVVSRLVGDDAFDPVLDCIAEFQKTNDTKHLYNALAYFDENHWDNCYTLCLEVAKHFEEGAAKYGPDNWKRGIPTWCYIDSAIRHYLKWLRGDNDENHDRAFCWNIMCCIWEVDYHKEKAE